MKIFYNQLFSKKNVISNLSRLVDTRSFSQIKNIFKKELEVPLFCNICVNVPYNVNINPLDVHKYQNSDKLLIELQNGDENSLEYKINGDNIEINAKDTDDKTILCNIEAPVKANLAISSWKNINVGFFNGDILDLNSKNGNITVEKFQGENVNIVTLNGDINLKNSIQSSVINISVLENGSIFTERLLAIKLNLKAESGNISVGSSYATQTLFQVSNGDMNLRNIHKSCRILLDNGNLNLHGFDGNLHATVTNGNIDMQLDRISGQSLINILKSGHLNLKISDDCCENSNFEILAKECEVSKEIGLKHSLSHNVLMLSPKVLNEDSNMKINCINSCISIGKASWEDIFKSITK